MTLEEKKQKAAIDFAGLTPNIEKEYTCGTCGSNQSEPRNGLCFVCGDDNWETDKPDPTKPTKDQVIREVAEYLMGTTNTVQQALNILGYDEEFQEEDIEGEELDDLVALCDQCGWWCEPSEMNEEQHCEDCANE